MRFVSCSNCQNNRVPLNASIQVDDAHYCENCLKEKFSDASAFKGKRVVKEFDPTICSSCAQDFGDTPLNRMGEYPMCGFCTKKIKARIFPTWVKAFFAGVVLLVIFSFVWNWRFIRAYHMTKDGGAAVESGNFGQAAKIFRSASTSVPEIMEYATLAEYYTGISLLQQDSGAQALDAFRKCSDLPKEYGVDLYMTQAEIDVLYDIKDYSGFVRSAKKYLSYDTSATALAQVASAYSCLYADQKADSAKASANWYLFKAQMKKDTTQDFADYVKLIQYRLATGEIISRQQFLEKFPNGWTNN